MKILSANKKVWNKLYQKGNFMHYPTERLIKCLHHYSVNLAGKKVLDLGCGSGANLIYLAQSGALVYGCDLSPTAVKITEKRLKQLKLTGRVNVSKDKLPYKSNFFDLVISWETLYYADSQALPIITDEISRILKPKGKILFTMIRPDDQLVKFSRKINPLTYCVDSRLTAQKGAIIYVLPDKKAIIPLFNQFNLLDIGYYQAELKGLISSQWTIFGEKK